MNSRRIHPRLQRRQAGVTLVETVTVTAVVAVVAGTAVPGFERALQKHRLEGAAAQLETDIHYARSLAVARNLPLRISFDNAAACYVIHSGAAKQCSCAADGSATCTGGAQAERSVGLAAGGKLVLKLESTHGMAVHQVMNIMGRVRSCSPAPGLSGYARC